MKHELNEEDRKWVEETAEEMLEELRQRASDEGDPEEDESDDTSRYAVLRDAIYDEIVNGFTLSYLEGIVSAKRRAEAAALPADHDPVCEFCGAEAAHLTRDAVAHWDDEERRWHMDETEGDIWCAKCDTEALMAGE